MESQAYIRSSYTLLSSMCTLKATINKAKNEGYRCLALVDQKVLSGAMAFHKECLNAGIKPVYGLEFEIIIEERIYNCLLYARNDDGFKNLMALSSYINTSGEEVNLAILNKYKANNFLVLLSDSCPLTIAIDKNDDIETCLKQQQSYFGKDYLIALVDNNIAINQRRNQRIKDIAKEHGLKTLALSRTFYLEKNDFKEYEVLKCIRDKRTLEADTFYEEGRHFLSKQEFNSLYAEEDLKNTDILCSLCNVEFNYKTSLPKYQTPKGISSKDYLVALCKEGLKRRLKNNLNKEYVKRLEYELKVIIEMHFEDYFLIVYDFILYAKKQGIMVGPGRGSAASSLVSYCLGITDIDPLKYGLLFERFLNPERVSMPDIDTDFPDDAREQMFAYVRDKYGKEHVAHIVTYGTLKAKQVLRDVGRALKYNNYDIDNICKLIPFALSNSLIDVYNGSPIFRQKIESEEKYRRLFKISLKLEGLPRHESTHAAGVVMSLKPLSEVIPVISIESDLNSTQYTMEYLEELGLIKMDFLGLRNLGIIKEIVDEINVKEEFNIHNIPLDDVKTFKLIDEVNLLGVFQLESAGMQNLARKMKPKTFEELGMMIALFRPGPMENIPLFLENRANPSKINYLVPSLKPILAETYGIIIYQEQIMTIARVLAGFSYGKADLLRRAMSKKKASELEKLQSDFVEGCINNGYERKVAEELYALVLKFANYGFNKSHSIAYGLVAYQLAYLKANYPLYFYKALLNGVIGSQTKTYEYIQECRKVKQKLRGLSINHSGTTYLINNDEIILPLSICKDVGSVSGHKIIEERESHGPFKDYVDCIFRLSSNGVEKDVLENLIYAGALDEFGLSRYTMIKALTNTLKYANAHKGENVILDLDDAPIIENYQDDLMVKCENERNVLGFYFSYNPILSVKAKNNIDTLSLNIIRNNLGPCKGFGMLKNIKTHKTKKGDMMCFCDINDDSGDLSLVVMPNLYGPNSASFTKGRYLYFEGNLEKEGSVLVKKLNIL